MKKKVREWLELNGRRLVELKLLGGRDIFNNKINLGVSKLTREELIDRIKEYKISNVLTEYSIGNENLNLKNLKEDTVSEISKIKKEEYPEEINRKGMKWSKKYGVLTFIPE